MVAHRQTFLLLLSYSLQPVVEPVLFVQESCKASLLGRREFIRSTRETSVTHLHAKPQLKAYAFVQLCLVEICILVLVVDFCAEFVSSFVR
jgi:hypothetical protein